MIGILDFSSILFTASWRQNNHKNTFPNTFILGKYFVAIRSSYGAHRAVFRQELQGTFFR